MGNLSSKPLTPAPKWACLTQAVLYAYLFSRGVAHLRHQLKKRGKDTPKWKKVEDCQDEQMLRRLHRDLGLFAGVYLTDILVAVLFRRGLLHSWKIADLIEHHAPAVFVMLAGPISDRLRSWGTKESDGKRDSFQTTKWMRWWYIAALLSNGNEAIWCLRSIAPKNRLLYKLRFLAGLVVLLGIYAAEWGALREFYGKALGNTRSKIELPEVVFSNFLLWGLILHTRFLKGYAKSLHRNWRQRALTKAIELSIAQEYPHMGWVANGGM